jgi:TorA maturation chaperone TorD
VSVLASVTIHHLEVRFQVEADDQAVFRQLFERHIRPWHLAYEQECARRARGAQERAFGDRGAT